MGYRPFEALSDLLKGIPHRHSGEDVREDGDDLFRRAMADVREIKEFRKIPYRRPRRPPVRRQGRDEIEEVSQILSEIVAGTRPIPLHLTQEYIEWTDRDLTGEITKMLHQGRLSVQDYLDLHGYSIEEARIMLRDFLRRSILKGHRCVKIIHGRGLRSKEGPKMKKAVTGWLEKDYRGWIMAYVTARAEDGGTGAVYVLLRKRT